ncbi:MAG TPA: serine--tRNA ligase [Gemmatimonadales bacterium]|nr:serine--tRNA ligase [Gemmatimonadales bacterium]
MIDLRRLRQDPDGVRGQLARRGDAAVGGLLDELLALDLQRRQILSRAEALKAERNKATEEVARLKRAKEPADALMADLRASGDEVRALDAALREVDEALEARALGVPNLPDPACPDGDATANAIVRTWGEATRFPFVARPHWELGERLGILDLPRGAKLTGSGFPLFVGLGARLVRALEQFMLDLHTREHGYVEVAPPLLLNRASLTGTGQLPKFEEDLYRVERDELFLLPTAEVPVTNLHRDEILEGDALPLAYVASTPCFRREAGAHGKDTRGLIRVHQFDKVEIVRLVRPEEGAAELERITAHAEVVLQRLGLPYRVLSLAAGDIGFANARTFDLEVWAPGVDGWLEVSSASTYSDFQARRANIRYRPTAGAKPEFVHTLNASGLAFPRTIIALLENGQQADGSVHLPEALAPYLGTDRLVPRA